MAGDDNIEYTTILKDRISGDYIELNFNTLDNLERFMDDVSIGLKNKDRYKIISKIDEKQPLLIRRAYLKDNMALDHYPGKIHKPCLKEESKEESEVYTIVFYSEKNTDTWYFLEFSDKESFEYWYSQNRKNPEVKKYGEPSDYMIRKPLTPGEAKLLIENYGYGIPYFERPYKLIMAGFDGNKTRLKAFSIEEPHE